MKITRNDVLFVLGILLALWFTVIGIMWVLLAALVYAYPAGLLSLLCWYKIKDENKPRTKIIPWILGIGLVLSLTSLAMHYINGEQKAKEAAIEDAKKARENKIPVGDNSNVSLDWNGTYIGTLPCNDCDSTVTTITLNLNNTYTKQEVFIGPGAKQKAFSESGKIEWSTSGDSIILNAGTGYTYFKVGENMLLAAEHNGKPISTVNQNKYVLNKKR
jgi:uncharacterized lipoprotein NlpE involved in copper resistance